MSHSQDIVILDGYQAIEPWPLDLAEAFLQDGPYQDRTWSVQALNAPDKFGIRDSEHAFIYLASWVNGYNRWPNAQDWNVLLSAINKASSYEQCRTQDLFDILFYYYRRDYWNGGGTLESELPKLRAIVNEIVRRMHSDIPPTFVLKGSQE